MGHAYVQLNLKGEHERSLQLIRDKRLQKEPGAIDHWLEQRGFVPEARWCFGSRHIYRAIMVDLLSQDHNSFKREFVNLADSLTRKEHAFVTCSGNRDHDYYWSCGLRYNAAVDGGNMQGFNVWGEELDKLLSGYRAHQFVVQFSLQALLSDELNLMTYAPKTLLILGDSQLHHLESVWGGRVMSVGGATFGDLARKVREEKLDLTEFNYVSICCSVNDAQRSRTEQLRSWNELWSLIEPLSHGDTPKFLVSLAVLHPDPALKEKITDHSDLISSKLEGTKVKCVNWVDQDYDTFMFADGAQNRRLFEKGGPRARTPYFHINHAGIREIWRKWCFVYPELSHLPFTLRPIVRSNPSTLARATDKTRPDQPGASGARESREGCSRWSYNGFHSGPDRFGSGHTHASMSHGHRVYRGYNQTRHRVNSYDRTYRPQHSQGNYSGHRSRYSVSDRFGTER